MRKSRKEIIVIREDKGGGYFAVSSKYAGLVGHGETPEEALQDLKKAEKTLEECQKWGEVIKKRRSCSSSSA